MNYYCVLDGDLIKVLCATEDVVPNGAIRIDKVAYKTYLEALNSVKYRDGYDTVIKLYVDGHTEVKYEEINVSE